MRGTTGHLGALPPRSYTPNPNPNPDQVHAYLEAIGCDPETGEKVGEYMELKTPTLALTLAQTLTLTLALALTLTLALHGL